MAGAHAHAQITRDEQHEHFIHIGKICKKFRVSRMLESSLAHGLLVNRKGHQYIHFRAREVVDHGFQGFHGEQSGCCVHLAPLDFPRFILNGNHVDLILLRFIRARDFRPIHIRHRSHFHSRFDEVRSCVKDGRCLPKHAGV